MRIRVRNNTGVEVLFRDYYCSDPVTKSGYYGLERLPITANGTTPVSSSKFTALVRQNLPNHQEIRVLPKDAGKEAPPLLTLSHHEFENNDGNDLFLEHDSNNKVTYRFAAPETEPLPNPEGRSLLQKIRAFIR